VYAFSIENWGRPPAETAALLALIEREVLAEAHRLLQLGVRLRFIGDLERLPASLQATLLKAADREPPEQRLLLCVALSYGGRQEIARAARRLAERVEAGEMRATDVDDDTFAAELRHPECSVPSDPDLLVRTGGQLRLSNFLLFQSAYTELVMLECFWPDFNAEQLAIALRAFAARRRTFGRR